jgi:hypothetical protein
MIFGSTVIFMNSSPIITILLYKMILGGTEIWAKNFKKKNKKRVSSLIFTCQRSNRLPLLLLFFSKIGPPYPKRNGKKKTWHACKALSSCPFHFGEAAQRRKFLGDFTAIMHGDWWESEGYTIILACTSISIPFWIIEASASLLLIITLVHTIILQFLSPFYIIKALFRY